MQLLAKLLAHRMQLDTQQKTMMQRKDRVRFPSFFFFFQAEDGIRDLTVTGVQTCALPICYQLAAKLKVKLFSHLQRLSLAFHTHVPSGELVVKMASDTTAIRDLFTDWGVRALYQSSVIGGMLVVMIVVNWRLALVVLGSIPVLFIALARLNQKLRASISRQRKQEGRIASRMNEVLGEIGRAHV